MKPVAEVAEQQLAERPRQGPDDVQPGFGRLAAVDPATPKAGHSGLHLAGHGVDQEMARRQQQQRRQHGSRRSGSLQQGSLSELRSCGLRRFQLGLLAGFQRRPANSGW